MNPKRNLDCKYAHVAVIRVGTDRAGCRRTQLIPTTAIGPTTMLVPALHNDYLTL